MDNHKAEVLLENLGQNNAGTEDGKMRPNHFKHWKRHTTVPLHK